MVLVPLLKLPASKYGYMRNGSALNNKNADLAVCFNHWLASSGLYAKLCQSSTAKHGDILIGHEDAKFFTLNISAGRRSGVAISSHVGMVRHIIRARM